MNFLESNPSTDNAAINAVEQRMHIQFPDALRKHLLRFNGGHPEKRAFYFGDDDIFLVDYFFNVHPGAPLNFEKTYSILRANPKVLPLGIIPFADDPFGNFYCISTRETTYGKIYFWDHEKNEEVISDDEWPKEMILLADSLDEFINGLKDEPE